MYNPQQFEQAVFEALVFTLRQKAPGDAFFQYGLTILQENNFQNSRMMNMLRTAIILFQGRARENRGASPEQLLLSICEQLLSVLIANIVKDDAPAMDSLNFAQKAWVTTNAAYAAVIDAEEEAFEQLLAQPGSQLYSPDGYAPKVSDRFKGRRSVPTPPTPTTSTGPVGVTVPDVHVHTSGRFARRATITETPAPKQKQTAPKTGTTIAYNPHTHVVTASGEVIEKEQAMAYADHADLIRQQVQKRTTTPTHTNALEVLAGGVVFNPFELDVSKTQVAAEDSDMMPTISCVTPRDKSILAMSLSHADMMIHRYMSAMKIETDGMPYFYDYRDFHFVRTVSNEFPIDPVYKPDYLTDFDSLARWIKELTVVNPEFADRVNLEATKMINDLLWLYCGVDIYIDEFLTDYEELLKHIDENCDERVRNLVKGAQSGIPAQMLDFRIEQPIDGELDALSNWGIAPVDDSCRIIGYSYWHAVMHVCVSAAELAVDIVNVGKSGAGKDWALITVDQAPLFYQIADGMFDRLRMNAWYYRTITLVTTDGIHYRVRQTELRDQYSRFKIAARIVPAD